MPVMGPDPEKGAPASCDLPVEVHGGIEGAPGQDSVAEEVPVAMVYNGISHAVMMASPCDLEDFALGFSLTEGIIDSPGQLFNLNVHAVDEGIAIEMHIAGDCFARTNRLRAMRHRIPGPCGPGDPTRAASPDTR